MIIRSIRMKNIKSFGDGPDGNGVVIKFDSGINRIGGKNGSGKSSIIESIGYALFDAEPERGDNRFRVESYLVRTGQKSGEIDVWVETGDGIYRVERDIGQTKRRWKVLREDDGFIEAEGDREVREFLAVLWGLPGPERLSELFHGLIGVKQGRFTQPFDCAPSIARGHFDPLLDVDIFRRCFDYLLEPLRMLNEEKHQTENRLSGLDGQLLSLGDAAEKAGKAAGTLTEAEETLELMTKQVALAQQELSRYEAVYQAKNQAQQDLALSGQLLANVKESLAAARVDYEEAHHAAGLILASEAGYHDYRAAEAALKSKEAERAVRDRLAAEISEENLNQGRLTQEKQTEEKSRSEYVAIAEKKNAEAEMRGVGLSGQKAELQALMTAAEQNADRAQRARAAVERIDRWYHGLSTGLSQMRQELIQADGFEIELKALNGNGLAQAEKSGEDARLAAESARVALARSDQGIEHLSLQLESIRGGVCPFLGEACRQFNPDLIRNQLDALEKTRELCRKDLAAAEARARAEEEKLAEERKLEKNLTAKRQLLEKALETLDRIWKQIADAEAARYADTLAARWPGETLNPIPVVEGTSSIEDWKQAVDQLADFAAGLGRCLGIWRDKADTLLRESRELSERAAREKGLIDQLTDELERLAQEAEKFKGMADQSDVRISQIEKALAESVEKLTVLKTAAADYGQLDQTMAELRSRMESNRPVFDEYIRYQPFAAKRDEREARLRAAEEGENQAQQRVSAAEKAFADLENAYREDLHAKSKEDLARQLELKGQAESVLIQARQDCEAEQARFQQYEELTKRRRIELKEKDGIMGRSIVLEKARSTLKNAQTLVAQGLTRRIQNRAQTIFNAMSREPVQFEWDPGEYKLTIQTTGGSRRFTQLSGGQQMKVAIAMQLALVKEFSSAGFCAFDEPTYGLDAESRALLADAIVQAQNECRFEQLFVVSHDEAFDDKVEHLVQLGYSSKQGTETVAND